MMADFTDAMEKIVLGTERQIMMSQDEKERTAFHESGHALLGMLQPGADPVRKISIIPRGRALGVTFQSPDADRYAYDRDYLRGKIIGALGGRAAEEVVFGSMTTGAENDLVQVTRIARSMVGQMGDVGGDRAGHGDRRAPRSLHPVGGLGEHPGVDRHRGPSNRRRVLRASAIITLKEHRPQLDALAQALLQKETLEEIEAYAIAGIDRPATAGTSRIVRQQQLPLHDCEARSHRARRLEFFDASRVTRWTRAPSSKPGRTIPSVMGSSCTSGGTLPGLPSTRDLAVAPMLSTRLAQRGIERLYRHQVEAIELDQGGSTCGAGRGHRRRQIPLLPGPDHRDVTGGSQGDLVADLSDQGPRPGPGRFAPPIQLPGGNRIDLRR